jgi:ribosome biogenesis GTPase
MVEFIEHTYKSVTKEILKITIKSKDDINNVKDLLINKITLLSGNSGVGKSSIIRSINPALDIKIGEISSYHNKGKHTTTFSEIFEIAPNTFIVDTPGIKGFGLVDIKKEEVSHFFPEIFAESSNCKFHNCTHVHEPGCAVIQAVEEGRVSGMRYLSYLKIMEEDEGKYRK